MSDLDYIYTNCKLVKVIDGDTMRINVDLGFGIKSLKTFRVYDYDAPEKALYEGVSVEEKQAGLDAKEFAIKLLTSAKLRIQTYKDRTGKYGRYLADIYYYDSGMKTFRNFADVMIAEGFTKARFRT